MRNREPRRANALERFHKLHPQFARKRATRRNDRDDRLDILAVIFGGGMEVGR